MGPVGRSVPPGLVAVTILLLGSAPTQAADGGTAEEQARILVNRLLESAHRDYESLDRDSSPTRLANEALASAATPEGAAVLQGALAEAIASPFPWTEFGAAELARFLVGGAPPAIGELAFFRLHEFHGCLAIVRRTVLLGGGGCPPQEFEVAKAAAREVRDLLLEGKTPFRPRLRPDPPALLRAIRSHSPAVARYLAMDGDWPAFGGVDAGLGIPLGEAAAADPTLGKSLLAAASGQDGYPPPAGTERNLLLLALGRWGSAEALALLGKQLRTVFGRGLTSSSDAAVELRLFGAAFHLAGDDAALLRLRAQFSDQFDPALLEQFDLHVGRDAVLRARLRQAMAHPDREHIEGLARLAGGGHPWEGDSLSRQARWEVLDFLLDSAAGAAGVEREVLLGALGVACCKWVGRTGDCSDPPAFSGVAERVPWRAECLGLLPDALTAGRVMREARGAPSPEHLRAGPGVEQAPLTPVLPESAPGGGMPAAVRVRASVRDAVLHVGIENVGKEPFTIDPTAFRIAEGSLYTAKTSDGRSHAVLGVGFGGPTTLGTPDITADRLQVLPPGKIAEYSMRLPPGIPAGTGVYTWYQALRVRGGTRHPPLLHYFRPVWAGRL